MRLFGTKQAKPSAPAVQAAPAPVPADPAKGRSLKKYIFEADKRLLEKSTEPNHVFTPPARVCVWAEDEKSAGALAARKLAAAYAGTGTVLAEPALLECVAPPEDWSYGYGSAKKSGPTKTLGDLVGQSVIR